METRGWNYNDLHSRARDGGTVGEVEALLASSDGKKFAMEKDIVSEDTVHNPPHTPICILFFSLSSRHAHAIALSPITDTLPANTLIHSLLSSHPFPF